MQRLVSRRTRTTGVIVVMAVAATLSLWTSGLHAGQGAVAASAPRAAARRTAGDGRTLKVLFLGHTSTHHPSMALMPILAAPLARTGIQLTHVTSPEDALRPEVLARYDALMIYANHKTLTAAQEAALMAFVEGGKGLVALHCASAMFT